MTENGMVQARTAADSLDGVAITELLCSPLQRAVQTAQAIGWACNIDIARDQRLSALALGEWEGHTRDELAEDSLYRRFQSHPEDVLLPGGEGIEAARRRSIAAVDQALGDAAAGDVLAVVTHSAIIRLLLGHYLGAPASAFRRLQVSPCSFSLVSFGYDGNACVEAVNYRGAFVRLVAQT